MDHIDHLIWAFPVAVAGFGVKFLRDMSRSMAELNRNIAVLVTRLDGHEHQLDDHEHRLRTVEHGGEKG